MLDLSGTDFLSIYRIDSAHDKTGIISLFFFIVSFMLLIIKWKCFLLCSDAQLPLPADVIMRECSPPRGALLKVWCQNRTVNNANNAFDGLHWFMCPVNKCRFIQPDVSELLKVRYRTRRKRSLGVFFFCGLSIPLDGWPWLFKL